MKKVIFSLVALPLMVWAASPFTASLKAGKYEGNFKSIVPQMNGQKCLVDIKTVAENLEATVNCGQGETATKEVWTFNDKTLVQREFDVKTGKTVQEYSATASATPVGNSQTYLINCKDRAANVCDAGIDSRHTWTIRTTANGFEYVVNGVNQEEKGNLNAKPVQRHLFSATFSQ